MMKSKINCGFTLIEILIVMAIGFLIFASGFVSYIDFNRNQTTRSTGLALKNNLRNTQSLALSEVKPSVCLTTDDLQSYRVSFPNSSSYTTQAVCSGTLKGPTTTYTLPATFQFSPVPAAIDFLVLGQGVSSDQLITMRGYQTPYRYYSICVKKGGEIKDCGYVSGASPPTCTCP